MRVLPFMRCLLLLAICVVVTSCSTKRGAGRIGSDNDILTPGQLDQLDGDYALEGRFGEGSRVTDVTLERVAFSYDSFQVSETEVPKIRQAAEYMQSNPAIRLVVEGHCDERGSRDYNMSLGEHRALAVRAYLIMLGVDSSRVQTRSFGEEMPLDSGHSAAAHELNRRAEFVLFR